MSTIKEEEAVRRISGYCAKSEQSRADVYEKLKKWEFTHEAIENILNVLETSGFIDDQRFSRSFISDKFRFNKWGRLKIAQALALRGIPAEVYRPCLNEIDEDEYLATLKKIIHTKKRSVQGKNNRDKEAKLIRFAAGRGFEMQYIRQCLNMPDED